MLHSFQFHPDMIGRNLTYFYVATLFCWARYLLKRPGRVEPTLKIYLMFLKLYAYQLP